MTGYSGTPLAQKLGIKAGDAVAMAGAPEGFATGLGPLKAGVRLLTPRARSADLVIVFATRRPDMTRRFHRAMRQIPANGAIWVAWPKRSSGLATDLTEEVMRELFLPTGMVDNKVCAIDETWSGLRFVVRVENRADWAP